MDTKTEKFELNGSELRLIAPLDFEYEDFHVLKVKAVSELGEFSIANIGIQVKVKK